MHNAGEKQDRKSSLMNGTTLLTYHISTAESQAQYSTTWNGRIDYDLEWIR